MLPVAVGVVLVTAKVSPERSSYQLGANLGLRPKIANTSLRKGYQQRLDLYPILG